MTREEILKEKDLVITQIEEYVPLFKPFFSKDITVREYSANLYDFAVDPIHKERQSLIKKVIDQKLKKLYGENYSNEFNVNLEQKLAFNIVDHHQVLNHALLIGSNVISSVNKLFQEIKPEATIVISSGDVPPNNYFSKNGFQFHDKRVPLFSVSEKEYCSYYIPKRDFDFVNRLKIANRWQEFNKQEQTFLQTLQEQFDSFDFSHCSDYNDQVSIIVKNTWPLMFEPATRQTLPELLYLTQEEITTECLIELLEQDTFVSECLFNSDFQEKVLNNFRGIVVAWREEKGKGTHFFWKKYPGRPQAIRLYIENGQLVPQHENYKDQTIPLDRRTLIQLLKDKEIYPSLFLIFTVLIYYSGVKPLTGYGSTVYLQFFTQAWLKTLEEMGYSEEAERIKTIDTTGFIGGVPIFFKRIDGQLKTLYATDIFYEGGMSREYLEKIFNMKFSGLLSVAVADLYDYFSQKYIPEKERLRLKINFDDLAELTFHDL